MGTTVVRNERDINPVLRRMRVFPKNVQKTFTRAMRRAVLLLESEASKRTPVGVGDSPTGHLRVSIFSEIRGSQMQIRGTVGSPSDYGLAVELGSRPHWPPPGVLVRWAQLKFGISAKQAVRVDFLLRRAISRRGTPAVKMFGRAFRVARPRIDTYMVAAMRRVARQTFGRGR